MERMATFVVIFLVLASTLSGAQPRHRPPCKRCPVSAKAVTCGHCPPNPWHWCHWWHSSCDMVQRLDIPHPDSGNYAFYPYTVADLQRQASIASGWGIDPRNPYSNEIFNTLFEDSKETTRSDNSPKTSSQDSNKTKRWRKNVFIRFDSVAREE